MAKRIESPQNKLVKRIHGYKLRKNREKDRVFVAEGLRFVSEIPVDWPVECYVVSDGFAAEQPLSAAALFSQGGTLVQFFRAEVVKDLRFDPRTAALEGLILLGRPRLFGLLGRQEDVFIPWQEIETVGADVILVRTQLPSGAPKARGGFWTRLLE